MIDLSRIAAFGKQMRRKKSESDHETDSPETSYYRLRRRPDLSRAQQFNLVRVCRRLGRIVEALEELRAIEFSGVAPETVMETADFMVAHGQHESALRCISGLNPSRMSGAKLLHTQLIKFAIAWDRGDRVQARDGLSQFSAATGLRSPNMVARLAQAAFALDSEAACVATLIEGLEEFPSSAMLNLRLIGMRIEMNDLDLARALVDEGCRRWPNNAPLRYRMLELLWKLGEFDEMGREIEKLNEDLHIDDATVQLVAFLQERSRDSDAADRFCSKAAQALVDTMDVRATTDLPAVGQKLLKLDHFEAAETAAERYLARHQLSPQAFMVRGAARFFKGENAAATEDMVRAVEIDPRIMEAYLHLSTLMPCRPDGCAAFEKVLAHRDQYNSPPWNHSIGGRRGAMDEPRLRLLMAQGRRADAFQTRLERPLCQHLARTRPSQYPKRAALAFSPERKRSVLIIAEDGVGDEVRTAQFYPLLRNHFDDVHITCDPRLAPLFRRSFPDFTFYPIKRRMGYLPVGYNDSRSAVPNDELARFLSTELFLRFDEFSEIRLGGDMLVGAWRTYPECAEEAGYVSPDPVHRQKWAARFPRGDRLLTVGLLWRSPLVNARRGKYYFDLDEIDDLLNVPGVRFVSLQPNLTDEEKALCAAKDVVDLEKEIDLYDDFEGIAALVSELDLVVGSSSFNTELAAAVGTKCWFMSKYEYFVRFRLGGAADDRDRITRNTRLIGTDFFGRGQVDDEAFFKNVITQAKRELAELVAGASTHAM